MTVPIGISRMGGTFFECEGRADIAEQGGRLGWRARRGQGGIRGPSSGGSPRLGLRVIEVFRWSVVKGLPAASAVTRCEKATREAIRKVQGREDGGLGAGTRSLRKIWSRSLLEDVVGERGAYKTGDVAAPQRRIRRHGEAVQVRPGRRFAREGPGEFGRTLGAPSLGFRFACLREVSGSLKVRF